MAVVKAYSAKVDGLTADQRACGLGLAAEVAGGVHLARALRETATELDGRAQAMASRRIIDLVVGIWIERSGLDSGMRSDRIGLPRQR